ncbi:MAG: PD-(D/E)XK nuclease-like domain-containing protein [Candidatus Bilamarchaeaceae archaeon]
MKFVRLSESEYRQNEALGFHDLMNLSKSYLHFQEGRRPKDQADWQRFGTAAHLMALEPSRFASEVVTRPTADRRTREGKALHESFERESAGKVVVTEEEMERLVAMRQMLHGSSAFNDILNCATHIEACAFCELESLRLKGRIDAAGTLPGGELFILEYKTTSDASWDEFQRDVHKYRYDLQLYHYAVVADQPQARLFIVAQEKTAPFDWTITEIEVSDVLAERYRELLSQAKKNLESREGYSKNLFVYRQRRFLWNN